MTGREAPVIAFDVKGEPAMAWYFVMAHWPDRETQPAIRIEFGKTIQILVPANPKCIDILRSTIERSRELPEMTRSSDTLLAELDQRVPQYLRSESRHSKA